MRAYCRVFGHLPALGAVQRELGRPHTLCWRCLHTVWLNDGRWW